MPKDNSPKKKKTMVALPGSLKNLVHTVQSGNPSQEADSAAKPAVGEGSAPTVEEPVAAQPAQTLAREEEPRSAAEPEAQEQQPSAEKEQPSVREEHPAGRSKNDGSGLADAPSKVAEPAASPSPVASPSPAVERPKAEQPKSPGRRVTVESTPDSWGLFLDLAREYKEKDSHLATIYIDRDLKTATSSTIRAATSMSTSTTRPLPNSTLPSSTRWT